MEKEKVKDQFVKEIEEIIEFMQTFLTEEKREYPDRLTVRKMGVGKTGKYAQTPRDVVDTGNLRDSLNVDITRRKESVTIKATWRTDYSEDVYVGYKKVPPYPWVEKALREIELKKVLGEK